MVIDNITFKTITINELNLLQLFLFHAGNSLTSFRYFNKRPLSIISNHLVTTLLMKQNKPVGYGHLEKDGDAIWLGIAIAETETNKGLGKLMMTHLTSVADKQRLSKIFLTVDKENIIAVRLYTKFGFPIVRHINDSTLLMERKQP